MTNWGIIGAGGIARVHVSLIHPHHAEWAIEAARAGGPSVRCARSARGAILDLGCYPASMSRFIAGAAKETS